MDIFSPTNFIAEDANNDALAGAKLYFYDAGTTDVRTVYQDAALTTAHTSPVVADSGGKFAAIYLPEGDFKYILTDSSDVTIDTVDNIPGKTATAAAVTSAIPDTDITTESASTTLTEGSHKGKWVQGDSTTADITYTFPSAVDLTNGIGLGIKNIGTDNVIVCRPVSSQTIEGNSTYIVPHGASVWFVSDGANLKAVNVSYDGLPQGQRIVSRTLTSPPLVPETGGVYIPATSPTGVWSSFEGYMMQDNGIGGYNAFAPPTGQTVYFAAESKPGINNGTPTSPSWASTPSTDASTTSNIKTFVARGTGVATVSAASFVDTPLDTVVSNDFGSDVALDTGTYEVTMVAGKYNVRASCAAKRVGIHYLRFENVADSNDYFDSPQTASSTATSSDPGPAMTTLDAVVEFTGSAKTYILKHYFTSAAAAANVNDSPDLVITDLTSIKGEKGDTGTQGNEGAASGFPYTLDLASQTDADPGAGLLRLNNATWASVTEVYVNDSDSNSNDISAIILSWDDSDSTIKGQLNIRKVGSIGDYATYNITGSSTDASGYVKLAVTYVAGNTGNLADTNNVSVDFARTGDKGDTGATGATGATGSTGAQGSPGLTAGLEYNFDTSTTMADPGSGDIRFNNATIASVTSIAIDNLDANGVDVTSYIDSWDDSTTVGNKGILEIQEFGSPENFVKFQITDDVVDSTGYRTLTVVYRSGNGTFADTDSLGIIFAPTGDKGTDGAGSVSSASNLGTGEGVYKQLNGGDLEFKGIKGTNGASVSSDTDSVTINVPNASTTTAGVIEAAIASEVNTGTSNSLAVTPDSLAGSNFGEQVVSLAVFDNSTSCATGDDALGNYFVVPSNMDGMDLVEVFASVGTAGTTGTMDIQIHNVTDTVDMLSTKLTIDSTEVDSSTAATAAVINTSNDDVSTGDRLRIDVDAVHSGTAALGLVVTLIFRLP